MELRFPEVSSALSYLGFLPTSEANCRLPEIVFPSASSALCWCFKALTSLLCNLLYISLPLWLLHPEVSAGLCFPFAFVFLSVGSTLVLGKKHTVK
jgi:hypothetical protein